MDTVTVTTFPEGLALEMTRDALDVPEDLGVGSELWMTLVRALARAGVRQVRATDGRLVNIEIRNGDDLVIRLAADTSQRSAPTWNVAYVITGTVTEMEETR